MPENNQKSNRFGPGLLGLIIGSIVGAAAVIFSDKEKRDEALKKVDELKKEANKVVKTLKEKTTDLKNEGEKTLEKAKKEIEKKIETKKRGPN